MNKWGVKKVEKGVGEKRKRKKKLCTANIVLCAPTVFLSLSYSLSHILLSRFFPFILSPVLFSLSSLALLSQYVSLFVLFFSPNCHVYPLFVCVGVFLSTNTRIGQHLLTKSKRRSPYDQNLSVFASFSLSFTHTHAHILTRTHFHC